MPEAPHKPVTIVVCMGSSCFSRGNNRNIEVIQDFLADHRLPAQVNLQGHLCEGLCKLGPNLLIDGMAYHEVDPVTVVGLLQYHLPRKAGNEP